MNYQAICEDLSQYALEALLFEVSATPKPGLVDRNNSGAHKDMNYFTFLSSASSLGTYFYDCAIAGISKNSLDVIFSKLREIGKKAERRMFIVTSGVNTHKGLVFSLGILCAVTSYLRFNNRKITIESLRESVTEMTTGICERELERLDGLGKLTHGEEIYLKYGLTGIRGEVESGFLTVVMKSYPFFLNLIKKYNKQINKVCVQTLLYLMTITEDVNIVSRHNLKTIIKVQKDASKILEQGGIFDKDGIQMIKELDQEYIGENISPGGSADLLAVTLMFYFILERKYIC